MKHKDFLEQIQEIKEQLQEQFVLKDKWFNSNPSDRDKREIAEIKNRISVLKDRKAKLKARYNLEQGKGIAIGIVPVQSKQPKNKQKKKVINAYQEAQRKYKEYEDRKASSGKR